jgi:predicted alpha-1,2-mannosidase
MKTIFFYLAIALHVCFFFSCNQADSIKKPVDWVNPFIGTGGHGHTYPGASMPFGMVQLSPDTRLTGWDGCSGYHYSDKIIFGFSHTHLNGTGIADYGDILFMPSTGDIQLSQDTSKGIEYSYASGFEHKDEQAKPGYYSVKLSKSGILAELTSTYRTGLHQYTFPESKNSHILLDLKHRDMVLESSLKIVNDSTIEGLRRSRSWANNQYVYFVAQFSKPFTSYNLYLNDSLKPNALELNGINIKAVFNYETRKDEKILVKVGISAVDIEGARKNLESENPDWDFNKLVENANKEWNKELSKIIVESDNQTDKTIFYTSLYHTMLNPNLYIDADGRYRGTDLQIHQGDSLKYYTVFSLWDTFRAAHPLYTIIDQKRSNDFIKTFLLQYQQGGKLPVWELSGNYTGTMIGYHAIPVIADAYAKGICDYDINLTFEAMKHSADMDHLGLDAYKTCGFIGIENESESVSKTLEYAYDDWCIAQIAKTLNKEADFKRFIERAQSYKNLFDNNSGFMRPKLNNVWKTPFHPAEVDFNFTEANSWQYSFFVPQDIETLIDFHGGDENFNNQLDTLFNTSSETKGREQSDITGLIGQYAHGNEPSHHMAYLYNYSGQPWKTQQIVRKILKEQYTALPDGLSGNEDCGQMSAWYVLSSMGLYPVTPGSVDYIIGSPVFENVTINLENGKQFIIEAPGITDKKIYIQSVKLNGKEYKNSFIKYNDIMNGGILHFDMGTKPNQQWGKEKENRPKSIISDHIIQPVPYIVAKGKTFKDSIQIELGSPVKDADIYYTTDGSDPSINSLKYSGSITLIQTTQIKAIAVKGEASISKPIISEFIKIPKGRKISLTFPYNNQYTGGGNDALIDFIKGGDDFRNGTWQGYQNDFEAVVDLGKEENISGLSLGTIQSIGSWIFTPQYVEFFTSSDGKSYIERGKVMSDVPETKDGSVIKEFSIKNQRIRARYIKVFAKNFGKLPGWHLGAGGQAWIFVDEISIIGPQMN